MKDNYFEILNRWMKFWYCDFWGQFHNEGQNICIHCGYPSYKKWEKRYNGYRGFCTRCECDWPES